ncbi:unnamed protein product [Caenorhabditis angaria]|uniref:Major facilitator superfamily (MFS) profile domain-containing protein n=1 Tax=Caenorhabditis angaria TaxID=860376 RepID=A0A9P1N7P4_9PELO|nr:unnamed protein product [Caenorhabditis angaria]
MPCQRTSWNVVYLMGIFSLIQNTQYSIYLTTMFAYMKKLNSSATEVDYGLIVATSSFGHCIGCFLLGYWNSRTGKSANSMYCGFFLMLLSNLVYLIIDFIPPEMVISTMMISRLLGGFGMGNSSPMRTCASLHSTSSDRSKAMASISGGRSVGTVVGPGLQLLFIPLGEIGFNILPGLFIHSNNAPAYLGIVLTILGILLLTFMFDENDLSEDSDKVAIADFYYKSVKLTYPNPDKTAMFICMLTRFIQNFMQIAIETLALPLVMMMFFQSSQEAVASMATTYLTTGLIATILYLAIIFTSLSKYVREKIFNCGVLLLFIVHLLITYPWQFYSTKVIDFPNNNGTSTCEEFSWCETITIPPEMLFYIGYILSFGLFMPFINVANATLYSKLLNPDNQGTHQSLYDISNTMARIFAPLIITKIYSDFGPRRVWEFMSLILALTASLWIIFDRRLVPIKAIEGKEIFEDNSGFENQQKKLVV